MARHKILGGKVTVYDRPDSKIWQCLSTINGKRFRVPTGEESLAAAKQWGEDWYLTKIGEARAGLIFSEKTFKEASKKFLEEYNILTEGKRSQKWTEGHEIRLRLHLNPFFGDLGLSRVTAGKIQEYRIHRASAKRKKVTANGVVAEKSPSRSTIHDEICTLRLVLKTALRHEWLDHLPDLSDIYKASTKVVHRPWFSPAEYKQLYEASRQYAKQPFHNHFKWNAEQIHDYILFMANTGLRPDEAGNLKHLDVTIVEDDATGQTILEMEVHGKRGVGHGKSLPAAVNVYKRLLARPLPGLAQGKRARRRRGETSEPSQVELKYPQPNDYVFPGNHIKLFNNLLKRVGLKFDREGNPRTAYSLRHTYICMRLMEGADVYQIAKNCRTSVEMIQKFYAAHIKNTLDTTQINVMRKKKRKNYPDSKNKQLINVGLEATS